MEGRKIARGVGIGILIVLGVIIFVSLGGFVVRGLWNWLMPELFGLPLITFWQGLGLLVLSRILFGGLGPGGPGGRRKGKGKRWKLSDEEKEHLQHAAQSEGQDAA